MSTTASNETAGRPMSGLCRRFEELRAQGVRPEPLAWAVGEAGDAALSLAAVSGRELVRRCLAGARSPRRSASEAEALLVIAAAGLERLRSELRSLGAPLAISRWEAFERMRRAERPDERGAMEAIRRAGALRVMAALEDRSAPFPSALAGEIVAASAAGEPDRVSALCSLAALGAGDLRRGLELDVAASIGELDAVLIERVGAQKNPRRALRQRARRGQGREAEALAALSFVGTRSLRAASAPSAAERPPTHQFEGGAERCSAV